jgi:predicted Rossmann fold flavoprotein
MSGAPVVVVGGGPAGMTAAIEASRGGRPVILFEKNNRLGRKLYLTGKGRCNITNACPASDFIDRIPCNNKFLRSAFSQFDNVALIEYMEGLGVPLAVEQGMRIFPASGKSSDVIRALEREVRRAGVRVMLGTAVSALRIRGGAVEAVEDWRGGTHPCAAVIVATGGLSYPATGSTGDGYGFAEAAGHTVTPCEPALTPINLLDPWAGSLQGLSLVHVALRVSRDRRTLFDEVGEMMFTHFGMTGPLVLKITGLFPGRTLREAQVAIDLKPGLTPGQLAARLLRDFAERPRVGLVNGLRSLLPRRIIPVVLEQAGIEATRTPSDVTREERRRIADAIKALRVTPGSLRSWDEAIVTRGGVACSEIHPRTLESKRVRGLFFAGEVLDIHGLTGGYNLQIAFSTGWCAGNYVKTL